MKFFFNFVNFFENGNRYWLENFMVNYFFDGLSNDKSHFAVV